jgi:hypothetical protein
MPSVRTHPRRLFAQLAVVPVVAAVVTLGVWVAGGLLTDDFRGSIALTTVWFVIAGVSCLLVAVRRPALRVPVLAAYRVVHERVVSAEAPRPVPPAASAPAADATPTARPRNVRLAHGRFASGEHATRGSAAIVKLTDGRRFLTLTSFSTSPGPDLRVRLASARTLDGGERGAVDLGALKGNRGDQQYRIPAGVGVRGRAVVIWCRAFSARFGSAVLS